MLQVLPAVPPVFDRLVVILVVQAHVFNGLALWQTWSFVTHRRLDLLCFAVSLIGPLLAPVLARRRGGVLPGRAFASLGAVLLVVCTVQGYTVDADHRGSAAMWAWGTVGVTWLAMAAFRPVRDCLAMAAGQCAIVLVTMIPQLHSPGVGGFRLLTDLNIAVAPALIAAQYLALYVRSGRRRVAAVLDEVAEHERALAAQAVETDTAERLAGLRLLAVPLLESVATGTARASDPALSRQARELAEQLRAQLVEARSGLWLLHDHGLLAAGSAQWPGLTVLDPGGLLRLLPLPVQARLSALVAALHGGGDWRRVSLSLVDEATSERSHPSSARQGSAPDPVQARRIHLALVAAGPLATAAAADPRLGAAAAALEATVSAEPPDLLFVQATVSTGTAFLDAHPGDHSRPAQPTRAPTHAPATRRR